MRSFTSAVLFIALSSSAVFAADNAQPLAAGKPAGVNAAQLGDVSPLVLVGVGAFAGAVAFLAVNSGNNQASASTSASTGTGP